MVDWEDAVYLKHKPNVVRTGKIVFNNMDNSHEILKRLNKLIALIEEQNDILLFDDEEPLDAIGVQSSCCVQGCTCNTKGKIS